MTQRVAIESDNSLISPFRHNIISLLLAFQPHGLTVLGSPKLGSKIFEKKIEEKASVLCFKISTLYLVPKSPTLDQKQSPQKKTFEKPIFFFH